MINSDTFSGPSFSLKNRVGRVLWNFVYAIFFTYSPRPFFQWRAFILRMFGAQVGKAVHVYPKVRIWAPWNLVLQDQCGIADGVNLYSQDLITIGKKTVISQGTELVTGTHDYRLPGFPLLTRPIWIGDNVWIAAGAFPALRSYSRRWLCYRSTFCGNIFYASVDDM